MQKLTPQQWLDRVIKANEKRRKSDQIPFNHLYKLIDEDERKKSKLAVKL